MVTSGTDAESLQKLTARVVATHPAGRNLMLIGGFRYRFLDNSVRTSDDIDYHWAGDLDSKQSELIALFRRKLLPEAKRMLGYEGDVARRSGPDADSPILRIVDLAFWKQDVPHSRVEIPVEITRIICADPVAVRTADGILYATVSDADMIESKVLAILNRHFLKHRDIVDLFLFQNQLRPDSGQRLAEKMATLGIPVASALKRIEDLRLNSNYHERAVQTIIDSQFHSVASDQLNDAGGGELVLSTAVDVLKKLMEEAQ
ncbi:MAG: hypothetical protein ACOC6C_05615 [Verrucomicrobiota bacterium]